jgi:hypothetical protein
MASESCLATLLESKDFGALDTDDQANRLARFMSDWFDPDHKLDTVDHVRLTARLRTHASKMKISAGEVMEILLPVARRLHAQSVYEREAARIRDEDRCATSPLIEEPVEKNVEASPTGDASTPPGDPEPDAAPRCGVSAEHQSEVISQPARAESVPLEQALHEAYLAASKRTEEPLAVQGGTPAKRSHRARKSKSTTTR